MLHARVEPQPLDWPAVPGLVAYRVGNRVGESPVWDAAQRCLWWIDVRAPQVLRLDPETSVVSRWELPETVGALGLLADGRLAVALRNRLAAFDPRCGAVRTIVEVETKQPNNRLNDGKVSPEGRWFVVGSMDDRESGKQPTGGLYRIGVDRRVEQLRSGLRVANGVAWSPDARVIYFSDSHLGIVWCASWNESTGEMGEPTRFCESGEDTGRPDGAAVASTGVYLSAGVSAARLNRFDPSGKRIEGTPLPCRAPTMPCFGCDRLDQLFVTSLVRPGWRLDVDGIDGSLLRFPSSEAGYAASRWKLT